MHGPRPPQGRMQPVESAFLTSSQVLLLPLALGPHLENPWKQVVAPRGGKRCWVGEGSG